MGKKCLLVKVGVLFRVTDSKISNFDGPQDYDNTEHVGEPTTSAQLIILIVATHRIHFSDVNGAITGTPASQTVFPH